jgi:uncharacterized membrane protein
MIAPVCALCGRRTATYVCQDCGRAVCGNCFDSTHWSCSECQSRLRSAAAPMQPMISPTFPLATWLFFAAFAIIFIGIVLMTLGSLSNLNMTGASSGVVILIGPIPIVLGAGQNSFALAVSAIFLTVFVLLFLLFLRKRTTQ